MKIAGFAINADAGLIDGSLYTLRRELNYYQQLGFPFVELAPHGLGVVYNGILHQQRAGHRGSTTKPSCADRVKRDVCGHG